MKFKTTRETTIASIPGLFIPAFSVLDTDAGPFKALTPERKRALERDCARLVGEAVLVPADPAQRRAARKGDALGPARNSGTL